ncbi:MAG: hypothetical protein O7H41_19790 [Planctomycetota bacterium]|nr:hypothetical protein [Planctomycetota bacterium]
MKLQKVRDLDLDVGVVDVAFLDEDRILVTSPVADVWSLDLDPSDARPTLVSPATDVLAPIARSFGKEAMDPAQGAYPRLVASDAAGSMVVNSHDFVLLKSPLSGEPKWLAISITWGLYYPDLIFSPDGARFAARSDTLIIYETEGWKWRTHDCSVVCAWHSTESKLLCLDFDNRLGWLDYTDWPEEPPPFELLGETSAKKKWEDPSGLAISPQGKTCLITLESGHLLWWNLDPLEVLNDVKSEDGAVYGVTGSPGRPWAAVECASGTRFWDLERQTPMGDLFPGISDIRFSPSGERFVTLSDTSTNPHPKKGQPGSRTATLWQVQIPRPPL